MADWEEIKRLAADFQKVQLSSTLQKLSERNCIEIINLLKERKIIDLIYTVDGKELLTTNQLIQDIRNELYVNGGRINLVELAKNLNVDLAHINTHIKDVLKGQKNIHSILGQLIDQTYVIKIANEINERLIQYGQINIGDLTIQYDLPAEFLQQHVVEKNLGKLIHAKQDLTDPKIYFTESFIMRCKAKIRGALAGLTRPTPITTILNHINITEKLFFSLFDQVSMYGALTSRMTGAQYVPHVYARSQMEWVNSFYKQNGYLEYDTLLRLGISDSKTYIRKQLNEDIIFLDSCAISKRLLEQTDADIEECITSKTLLDIQTNLPSVFNDKDIELILNQLLSKQKQQQTIIIDHFIISQGFLDNIIENLDNIINENAKLFVNNGKYQQYLIEQQTTVKQQQKHEDFNDEKLDKREERRRKATGGKSGGGTQGRETKTKSTKKTKQSNKQSTTDDYDNDNLEIDKKSQVKIITSDDIRKVIVTKLEEEGFDELIEPLIDYLLPKLNDKCLMIAGEIYATTIADRTANRRHTHNELQNKLNQLIGDVRLFEKGIKLLPDDLQIQLIKYLLKTLCTDIVTEILNYIANEQNINIVTDNFNNDQRIKFINDLPNDYRKVLLPLCKTLTGQSIDEFMQCVEDGLQLCSMIIKKIDKKKDRQLILNHKHELLEQLNKCDDLALILHLTVLILFTTVTQCMLHASGRHIAGILNYLKQYLNEEQIGELTSYHDFVTLMLSGGSEAENAKEKLKEKVSTIKNIANEFRKPGVEKS